MCNSLAACPDKTFTVDKDRKPQILTSDLHIKLLQNYLRYTYHNIIDIQGEFVRQFMDKPCSEGLSRLVA